MLNKPNLNKSRLDLTSTVGSALGPSFRLLPRAGNQIIKSLVFVIEVSRWERLNYFRSISLSLLATGQAVKVVGAEELEAALSATPRWR